MKRLLILTLLIYVPCLASAIDLMGPTISHWIDAEYQGERASWTDEQKLEYQQRIIERYESDPASIASSDTFPIALAYCYCNKLEKAADVLKGYPEGKIQSDAARYLLGIIKLDTGHPAEGIDYLRKSWLHGYQDALPFLTIGLARMGDQAEVSKLVPDLLELGPKTPGAGDALILSSLMLKPINTNLIKKATANIPDSTIIGLDDLEFRICIVGMWESGQERRARDLILKAEQKHGEAAIDSLAGTEHGQTLVIENYSKDPAAWKPEELLLAAVAYAAHKQYDKASRLLKNPQNI